MSTLSKSYHRSQLSVHNNIIDEKYGLNIYPPTLEFINVSQNESSTSIISIQNVSKTLKKIRIIGVLQQHESLFTIHTTNEYQNIAPGCCIDISITFLSKKLVSQSIYTQLRIGIKDRMIDGEINIETIAKIPSSNIEFESLMDFQTMVTKQSMTKQLLLKNTGQRKGYFKVKIPEKHKNQIQIDEKSLNGELDINSESKIQIKLTAPDKIGIFRCLLIIEIDKDENNTKTLDIICNICRHTINFLMPQTKSNIQQINFGELYFGQQRSFKGLLINNGPKPAHYSIYLKPNNSKNKNNKNKKDDITNTHYQPQSNDNETEDLSQQISDELSEEDGIKKNDESINNGKKDDFDEDSAPIKIDHEEGTLNPYESKLITISYIPQIMDKKKGFTTTYNAKDDILRMKLLLIIESKQCIKIPLNGIGFPVMHNLKPCTTFNFGECCVYDRRDLYFEFKNENKKMLLQYEFNKIACFNTNPSFGTLLPLQSVQILVTFKPKQLGKWKNIAMRLIFNENPKSFIDLFVNGTSNEYLPLSSKHDKYNKMHRNSSKYTSMTTDNNLLSKKAITRNHFGTEIIGGINKMPIDFKPTIKIINPENTENSKEITAVLKEKVGLQFITELPKEKSAYYRPEWNKSTCTKGLYPDKSDKNISVILSPDNTQPNLLYTFSNQDMLRRYRKTKKANEYLIYQRKKRKYYQQQKKLPPNRYDGNKGIIEAKEDEEPEKDIEIDKVDIGLNVFNGLKEPILDLPEMIKDDEQRLYLGDGQIIDSITDRLNFFKKCMIQKYNKKGAIGKMDENKLIKNKFKSTPETSAEIIDCQTTLTRKELKELKYSPDIMDFGKICIHSETAKNFSIINTMKKTILVEVKIEDEMKKFIKSHPMSQVIPSQHMAGFDIIFNAKTIEIFDKDIILLINGIHTISFRLKAEIISMDLKLSTNKLQFEFPAMDYLDFNLIKTISLNNELSAPTKYRFDTNSYKNNKEITIKPNSGIIQPNKSQNISFIWCPTTLRPKNHSMETDQVKLQIIDGLDKIIQIQTNLPLAKCTLSNKSINFNQISIGTEHTKRVHIKNNGHIQSIFRIIRLPSNLSVHPLFGKIDIGTSIPLSITYLSCKPAIFNENIIIEIRGGKTLKLNVMAQTILPQIKIKQNEFDFNGVTIGDTKLLPIEITNTSTVDANLFLEMTSNDLYPNTTFDIQYPSEWADLATEPTKAPILPLPCIDEDDLHSFIPPPANVINSRTSSKKSLHNNGSKESGVRFQIGDSRRSSIKTSRRSLLSRRASKKSILSTSDGTIIPSTYIRIVRSMENPNLLQQQKSSQTSLMENSMNANKLKLDTNTLVTSRSKKGLISPMRRGSLMAMSQHLSLIKDQEIELEKSESSNSMDSKSKQNKVEIEESDDGEMDEIRYRILIKPNSTIKFKISFNPKEINQYDFDLNLTMAGIAFDDEQGVLLRKCVFAQGLKPRIALSTRNISFFDVTVLSEMKSKSMPYQKEIIVTNQENNKIEWKLQLKDSMHHKHSNSMDLSPWKISPNQGVLQPLKDSTICINFAPVTDQLFRDNVDLLLSSTKQDDDGLMMKYLEIGLEGQASYPKLSFDQEFILLPVVPLHCKSNKLFMIKNHGYENLEIRYEIIDDKAAQFIHLRFPNGQIIGGNGPDELKVEISFTAQISTAFTTRIDFLDIDSNRFSIFVSGMTDNCILTNQPFLYHNDCRININSDHTSKEKDTGNNNNLCIVPRLELKQKRKNHLLRMDVLIPDDIPTNILCDISVLLRYLEANCYLKFDSNIDAFPQDLVTSNGKMIFDLVQFLSGKKIPGLKLEKTTRASTANKRSNKSSKMNTGRTDRSKISTSSKISNNNTTKQKDDQKDKNSQSQIERLIHNYAQLINFLKAHGALIIIRPEYCLSCSQYIKFVQISSTMSSQPPSSGAKGIKCNELKSSKSQSDMQKLKRQAERTHPMISYVTWTQLLFQIVRLFILQKVTFMDFIKNPDIKMMIENEDGFLLKYISNKRLTEDDMNEEEISGSIDGYEIMEERLMKSNVYTVHENILLLWISIHYNLMSKSRTQRFFENFSELSDGLGIGYLLQSYAPYISELERINTRTPLSDMDKTENATLIIQSMKKLGLNIAITMDDITKPVERNICLLILYLYQHLPKYKESNKKNIITFNGNLNEEITRKIHISNPSKISKICYEITMEGDPQFELKNSAFIVLAAQGKKKKNDKSLQPDKNEKIKKQDITKSVVNKKESAPNSRLSSARTNKSGMTALTSASEFLSQTLLEPEADVIISYTPRFMRPSNGRLTLLAKPFPDAIFPCKIPETMTFELKSSEIESKPVKQIQCKGKLYQSTKVEFEVNNPYIDDCEFNVIIKNIPIHHDVSTEKSSKKLIDSSLNETQSNKPCIPSPWHCDKKVIKIKGKQSIQFSMEYLPFNMNKHLCSITFCDNKYGEFLYNVHGESLLPDSIEMISLKCKDTESISHEINFGNNSFINPLLLKARQIAADRLSKQNNLRSIAKEEIKKISLQSSPCHYFVEISSPFYVAPKQLKLYNDKEAEKDNKFTFSFNPKGPGSYPCTIKFESHFIDGDNGTFNIGDIRIYDIDVTVQSEGTHAELEFTANANEKVIQKIPIVNSTDNDWRITAEIIGEAVNDFIINPQQKGEFVINAGSTGYYELCYAPKWITNNISAQLTLNNNATGEKYIYDLNCTSFEPLAKDHIVLECQAKSTIIHEFQIENPYYGKQDVEYKIESDLPGISGDSKILIKSTEKQKVYKLSITPQCGGNIHGSVSFLEEKNGKFVWYAMELICSSPEPEKIIKISAYLREVVCVEINLSNPLNEEIIFNVLITGDGLFGDEKFILQPKQNGIYKLHYSPLITGEIKGSISFSNEINGEFWYELVLIGKKPPNIQLKDMICSVGNVCHQKIFIENPFNEIIDLSKDENIFINNKNFYFKNKSKSISIPSTCIYPIILCYRPSLIGIKQECEIILKHNKLGEWNYNVMGFGKEPNIEKHTFIYAILHSRISKVISFQNPFDQILKIKIELEYEINDDKLNKIFQLFMKKSSNNKKNTYDVTPNSSLQIPIFFSPNTMKKYNANLVISTIIQRDDNKGNKSSERELIWNYPIIGLAEYKSSQLLKINCNARETFHKIWNVELDNYDYDKQQDDEFSIDVELIPSSDDIFNAKSSSTTSLLKNNNNTDQSDTSLSTSTSTSVQMMNKIIEKSLQIDLIKKKLSKESNKLQIEVLFEPLRAFNGISKLHIINKNGVRWTFQLNLNVNQAQVDDIIRIESQLHCTSSIMFGLNLNNNIQENNNNDDDDNINNNKPTTFKAYFTADSPFQFDVEPKSGVVDDDSEQQQNFIVSFTPSEYGAALNGKLIIETSIMEWSYRVIGTHPTYIPPNLNSFKPTVDDKISKHIQYKRQKEKNMIKSRNFVKRNMKATRKK